MERLQLNVALPKQLLDLVRDYCATNQVKLIDFVAEALEEKLECGMSMPAQTRDLVAAAVLPLVERVGRLEQDLEKLEQEYNQTSPSMKNDIWLLQKATIDGDGCLVNELQDLRSRLSALERSASNSPLADAPKAEQSPPPIPHPDTISRDGEFLHFLERLYAENSSKESSGRLTGACLALVRQKIKQLKTGINTTH